MTKSKFNKKKLIPFLAILTLVLLGVFNLNSGYAIRWEGDGAIFEPDDEHPIQYGAFIPEPNMYTTMSVDASNQGNYTMMNWLGQLLDNELVDYPGEDISQLYPWFFDNYIRDTTTDNDFIDPWDINWINVTGLKPGNINFSSYTFNSVFDYHVMIEGNTLDVPVHSSFPMQIDILINSKGPKILKFDWLTNNLFSNPLDDLALVSPSGKLVNTDLGLVEALGVFTNFDIFNYLAFVAHEKGTYRLLINAAHSEPMALYLEFLDTPITNLHINSLKFGGNADENPNTQDFWNLEWQNDWFKINGKKGDIFRLDIGIEYQDIYPQVNFWAPCDNGYVEYEPMGGPEGVYDVYFPISGSIYISFIDQQLENVYRYSLYLSEFETLYYNIGDNLTSIRVDRDQRKAIQFEIEEDSFVVFNYTLFPQPLGKPTIYAPGGNYRFLYEDSNTLECSDVIQNLYTKTAGSEDFYYYYLPAGTYKALIANQDVQYDGVVQISSNFIEYGNATIPINSLAYPDINPSQTVTLEFEPDEYYNGIYESKYAYLNITEPGQYFLNTTIYASDNLAGLPTSASPSVVLMYNTTTGEYYDYTAKALALDNNTFKAFNQDEDPVSPGDQLYIAYTSKWHDMHFTLTQGGGGGGSIYFSDPYIYDAETENWQRLVGSSDTTNDFYDNGTMILNMGDNNFNGWGLGVGNEFDLPYIDENQTYWLRFTCDSDYSPIPFIDFIQLSNITLEGDVNLALVGESGYEYADYYEYSIGIQPVELVINQEATYKYATQDPATRLFQTTNPYILGLEEGIYKLLITPHGWGGSEPLKIQFAVENFWSYHFEEIYNITAEPNLYLYQINNYTATGYGPNNITLFSYGLTTTFNSTELVVHPLGSNCYFVLECIGDANKWTQLVVAINNVSEYELYIMQDLPWVINAGPHDLEVESIGFVLTPTNTTYEFGVHTDHFYLIFEFQPTFLDEM